MKIHYCIAATACLAACEAPFALGPDPFTLDAGTEATPRHDAAPEAASAEGGPGEIGVGPTFDAAKVDGGLDVDVIDERSPDVLSSDAVAEAGTDAAIPEASVDVSVEAAGVDAPIIEAAVEAAPTPCDAGSVALSGCVPARTPDQFFVYWTTGGSCATWTTPPACRACGTYTCACLTANRVCGEEAGIVDCNAADAPALTVTCP